jgi:tetratricopeptide (TPR) repeat protein
MAMRDADKDRRKNLPIKNTNPPAKEPLSYHELKQFLMNARANALQWEQRAKENQEAVSLLTQVQQENQAYQIEVRELKAYAAQSYQKYLNEQNNYQQALCLYNDEKTKATELILLRNEWEQRAKENQEAASQLTQVQQSIQVYQVEVNDLKQQLAQNHQKYLDEQKNYQQALFLYNEALAKSTELISQREQWEQRAKENQEAAYQLIQIQQKIRDNQIEVNELRESAEQNYQKYLDEQKNYQQAVSRYHEEKARATELLTKYEEVKSERDNYVILYNEAQAQLKFERRSKAGIKGWETRRKAENERLKGEISEMVVLLRESLESKDEAINNLYVVAERMDRIQSLVDSVDNETTGNPVGLVQKFKRIWLAIKEIISE